jgi:putative peptide zinc metalloprotease protein
MRHRLLILLALVALQLFGPGAVQQARADDGSKGDNAAVAINTKDGSSLFRFAFSIEKVASDVVDNENAAVAYSSCTGCRTTAIAIQIVLVVGRPSTVTPANYAIAINENCTLCQSFAAAFQFVIGVEDDSVTLTRAGKRELRQILREFRALKREEYTLEEFNAKTNALGARLREVLRTELTSKRDRHDGADDEDVGREEETEERPASERPGPPAAPAETTTGGTTTAPATTTTTTPAETAPTTTGTTTTSPTTTETVPTTTTPTETTP